MKYVTMGDASWDTIENRRRTYEYIARQLNPTAMGIAAQVTDGEQEIG